jgi:hypothetical protein
MTSTPKLNLDAIVTARLKTIGADRTALVVRHAINADLLKAVTAFINEKINPDYVGDLTKRGLTEAAAANSATSSGGAL